MTDLKNKIAFVTGGRQGLGKEICSELLDAQAVVISGDIKEKFENMGTKFHTMKLDVADENNIKEVFEKIMNKFGKLDILINNAAIDLTQSIDTINTQSWQNIIHVNLIGPFLMTKYAFSIMDKNRQGQIINICSTASKRTWANASAYHASKWGLLGFSHASHVEGRGKNIKVTAVIAGGMKTPFLLERFPETEPNLQDPKNVAEVIRHILSLPEETVIPEVMIIPMKETSWP